MRETRLCAVRAAQRQHGCGIVCHRAPHGDESHGHSRCAYVGSTSHRWWGTAVAWMTQALVRRTRTTGRAGALQRPWDLECQCSVGHAALKTPRGDIRVRGLGEASKG
jgi:hypothetical protein